MSSFNIVNATMIHSNNNSRKNSNIENSFDHNSSSAPANCCHNQNIQTNRRNSQKDEGHPFHNTSGGSNTVSIDVTPREVAGVRYGKCKWFNVAKGWGFITPNDGGNEVFVHQSVIQMTGFRSLGEQEDVEFECHLTKRGLEATRVSGRQGVDCHGSTYRPRTKKRHRRVRCYNCGEFANHIASKCHLGPQPKRCHLCKQDDHLFANCPTKKNQSNESFQHSSNDPETPFTSDEDSKPEMAHVSSR